MIFHYTTHLSAILEKSETTPIVIFKFSATCGSSERLRKQFEEKIHGKELRHPVFLVTVQKEATLSRKIADWFSVRHESPQVFLIHKGNLIYTDHHSAIDLEKLT